MGSGHDPRHLETEQVFTRATILGWLDKHLENARYDYDHYRADGHDKTVAWAKIEMLGGLIEEVVACP